MCCLLRLGLGLLLCMIVVICLNLCRCGMIFDMLGFMWNVNKIMSADPLRHEMCNGRPGLHKYRTVLSKYKKDGFRIALLAIYDIMLL